MVEYNLVALRRMAVPRWSISGMSSTWLAWSMELPTRRRAGHAAARGLDLGRRSGKRR